jgi:heptosyltransferase-2
MLIHTDCRHFRSTVPCIPHKLHGVHCEGCSYYERTSFNILIIKLGAIGDVIRTTPLLRRLKREYPEAKIWWLTRTPEILPLLVDIRLPFQLESILTLEETPFELALNLDKDIEACAIMNKIAATTKRGFKLENGLCCPIDEAAYRMRRSVDIASLA